MEQSPRRNDLPKVSSYVPDNRAVKTSEKARLPWTKLRNEARECDILPSLEHNSLVSVGALADAGYYILFMSGGKRVQVYDAKNVRSTSQWKQYFEGGETTKDCGEYQ